MCAVYALMRPLSPTHLAGFRPPCWSAAMNPLSDAGLRRARTTAETPAKKSSRRGSVCASLSRAPAACGRSGGEEDGRGVCTATEGAWARAVCTGGLHGGREGGRGRGIDSQRGSVSAERR